MLTRKQRELLGFIDQYITASDGVCPSYNEMAEGIGAKSKSSVHRRLKGLEERGFIRRLPNRYRAIEIVRRPGDSLGQNTLLIEALELARATLSHNVPYDCGFSGGGDENFSVCPGCNAIEKIDAVLAPFTEAKNRRAA